MKLHIIAPLISSFILIFSLVKGQGIPERAIDISPLLIGEQIPEIALTNVMGETVPLKNIIESKPSVLIFYRGGWCSYCNLYLADLQRPFANKRILLVEDDDLNALVFISFIEEWAVKSQRLQMALRQLRKPGRQYMI